MFRVARLGAHWRAEQPLERGETGGREVAREGLARLELEDRLAVGAQVAVTRWAPGGRSSGT